MRSRKSPQAYLTSNSPKTYKSAGIQEYPRDMCRFCKGITICTNNNPNPVLESGYHLGCETEAIRLEKQNNEITQSS